jgi:hypothetical protein
VAVFGLSSGEATPQDLANFTGAFQVSFPILPDAEETGVVYRQTGGTSPYPLDYIIDQTGRIAYIGLEYDPDSMVAVIDELLAQPSPADLTPHLSPLRVTARPNPFNPRTIITFLLPRAGAVSLDIHDPRGRLVRRLLVDESHEAGESNVLWDGASDSGRALPTGLYLVRVRSGGASVTGKLTLIR